MTESKGNAIADILAIQYLLSTMNIKNNPKAKSLGNSQNRKAQKITSKEGANRSLQPGMKLYRKIPDMTRVMRMLRTSGTILANGSGIVAAANLFTSSVSSNGDWANIAQEFQQYRVRQMKLKLFPAYTTSVANSGANSYPHTFLYFGLWWDRSAAALTNVRQTDGVKTFATNKEHQLDTNFLGFVDGQLWTSTANSIPAEQTYGIGYAHDAVLALEPSSVVFSFCQEFDVEFQGMQ